MCRTVVAIRFVAMLRSTISITKLCRKQDDISLSAVHIRAYTIQYSMFCTFSFLVSTVASDLVFGASYHNFFAQKSNRCGVLVRSSLRSLLHADVAA